MDLSTVFVITILAYYVNNVVTLLFSKKSRVSIQNTNTRLEELRLMHNKTLDEQKQFIDLKYPKSTPFKFTWWWLLDLIKSIIIFGLIFYLLFQIFIYYKLEFSLMFAIFFMIAFPIFINFILKKFNLQSDDVSVFLRGVFK